MLSIQGMLQNISAISGGTLKFAIISTAVTTIILAITSDNRINEEIRADAIVVHMNVDTVLW